MQALHAAHAPACVQVFEFESLAQQRRAFERAAIVAGPHGTAFSGLAFAQTGVAIVEWGFERDVRHDSNQQAHTKPTLAPSEGART